MWKHDPFWHSSCSTSINQSAAVARFDFLSPFFNPPKFHPLSLPDKGIIWDNSINMALRMVLRIIVKNYQLYLSFLKQRDVLFNQITILGEDNFGLGVLCNVFASLLTVCSINTYRQTPCEHTPIECKTPFWSIESNYIHCCILF